LRSVANFQTMKCILLLCETGLQNEKEGTGKVELSLFLLSYCQTKGGGKGPFPRPLPLREGVPAGLDDSLWVGECPGGDGLTPSPLGEGWGEVLN
jgi:hypothetical protein